MTATVYLHIGTPKSGTTYLQAVLTSNKHRLADRAGLFYPGDGSQQVLAAQDILSDGRNDRARGAWDMLAREIGQWPGEAALVSMEWLGSANPQQVTRMVESLRPAEVKVLITVRDLARTMPAAWQEFCQNADVFTWSEFLSSVTADEPLSSPPGRLFWIQQDVGKMLAVWTDVLPKEALTVITVPPPGSIPHLLWARFAEALALPSGEGYDLAGGESNESLGLESAELMRRINILAKQQGVQWADYDRAFKQRLAKRVLSERRPKERILQLPAEYVDWVSARSEAMVAQVRAYDVRVVGELGDLLAAAKPSQAGPADLTDGDLLASALDGVVGLGRLMAQELDTGRKERDAIADASEQLHEELDAALEASAQSQSELARRRSRPMRQAAIDLSEQHAALMRLRVAWWRAANLTRRIVTGADRSTP